MANIIDSLIKRMAKLPSLGPSSSKKIALHLIKNKENVLKPLIIHLNELIETVKECEICGNLDEIQPCNICQSIKRDDKKICVVENISDLWAMERTAAFNGRYHVLGGALSALDNIHPKDLKIPDLINRCKQNQVSELILATGATIEGQTTAHYIAEQLASYDIKVTSLAHGMPMGGELDWLDDATITTALRARYEF